MEDKAASIEHGCAKARHPLAIPHKLQCSVDVLERLVQLDIPQGLRIGQTVECLRTRWDAAEPTLFIQFLPIFDGARKLAGVLKKRAVRLEPKLLVASHLHHPVAIGKRLVAL